jgi:ankyrin repeat protein
MHAQLQASMGHELYNACIAGNLDAVKVSLADSIAADPSFSPPVSKILHAAASKDHVKIVKYCLENGATVNRDLVLTVLINRARETYIHLLESKAVDINHYISWFGDILPNVATRDDLDWAKLCLDRGADPNRKSKSRGRLQNSSGRRGGACLGRNGGIAHSTRRERQR